MSFPIAIMSCCYECLPLFCRRERLEEIQVLVLGLEGSGKTELNYVLARQTRTEVTATNGLRIFTRQIGKFKVLLTEIGGSEEMRKIWHHYYAKAYAIIYVIDLSDETNLRKSYKILTNVIKHRHVQGKSILIFANKTDLCEHPNILDFYDRFSIESVANIYQSHVLLQCCGRGDYTELYSGIDWLRFRIDYEFQQLKNRVNFDVEAKRLEEKAEHDPINKPNRRHQSAFNRVRDLWRRPRSAPDFVSSSRRKTDEIPLSRIGRSIRKNRIHVIDQEPKKRQNENVQGQGDAAVRGAIGKVIAVKAAYETSSSD